MKPQTDPPERGGNIETDGYGEDPLAVLRAIDRLEVGPVVVGKNRLVAPYRVYAGNEVDSIDHIFTYEEDVFDPSDPVSINLAGMIAAQVAVNYGLFCDKIVFHGGFDAADQRFIKYAAENTAREIFVKKFLEDNPFLVGKARDLPPVKLGNYNRSVLEFVEPVGSDEITAWATGESPRDSYCILSSGGKDSLLSFGLLDELGKEIHPIFINESGRHWFTASNAHRYFRENIANTGRVWTNSDRVFNWMLRHLPFIRPDFQNVRSDEYPIRLWTVAVFLFGVLPLVRKRKISRIIIGDEFDTTRNASYRGIPHYDGLYDQSRYFDEKLSQYYSQKEWALRQFSILRPLSELLIQKILIERYPQLQSLQVSCHAAHMEDGRALPCGKCEKCRRIVAMIKALGGDPGKCGYTEKQVSECLNALSSGGIHQEKPVIDHVMHLLSIKNLIDIPEPEAKRLRPVPEVLKLRFVKPESPVDLIPVDLRYPLYKILGEHGGGAVIRREGEWVNYELTEGDRKLKKTNKLKGAEPKSAAGAGGHKRPAHETYLWSELTWPEAVERLKKTDIALLPVGAIEQHGPHLTLDVDSYDAYYLATRVAQECSEPRPLVLPLVPYGVSYHHDDFKGTISISNNTLSSLVYEIGIGIARNGIKKLVIINGHSGNSPTLNNAAQMINRDSRIFVCVDSGETSDFDLSPLVETPNDVHAGEYETSTSLALRPHLVKMEKAQKQVPEFSSRYLNFSSKRGVPWYARTKKISSSGVMGDPTKASAEAGNKMWEIMISHLVAFVEDLKDMTLEEIYQKRY